MLTCNTINELYNIIIHKEYEFKVCYDKFYHLFVLNEMNSCAGILSCYEPQLCGSEVSTCNYDLSAAQELISCPTYIITT